METVDGLECWVYDGKRYPSSGLSAVAGKSKEEFSPEPLPVLARCGPGATTRRPASRTWTRPASSRRCASRRSPGSAASCSWRRATASSGSSACGIYNDWLVEEWCGVAPGSLHPPHADPDVGSRARLRRRWSGWPAKRRDRVRLLGEPGAARPADDPRSGPLLGPGHGRGERAGHGGVDARGLVVAGTADRTRLPVHGQPRLGRRPDVGSDAVVAVQRHVPALPEPQDRAVRGRDRLDAVLPRAGRAGARQAAVTG